MPYSYNYNKRLKHFWKKGFINECSGKDPNKGEKRGIHIYFSYCTIHHTFNSYKISSVLKKLLEHEHD